MNDLATIIYTNDEADKQQSAEKKAKK